MVGWIKNILGLLLVASIIGLIATKPGHHNLVTGSPGQNIANLTVATNQGQVHIGTLLRHHGALINFWATWCPACRLELPAFRARPWLHHRLIMVSQGNPGATASFLRQHGLSQQFGYYDPTSRLFNQLLITTLPTSLFVNRRGVIVARVVGPLTPSLLQQSLSRTDN